ncbi:ParB/Srx family N-terminal domain-containing protein [Ralstonia solanacearum]|uniref:ParB/Srx family N-terminal domain-containing protein n=1 Tax=Ralstonia solanacearum TaxID=305 RepID=UPI0018D05822|nr:ParB/Srx family N-terminal domain-containing protein [Ralstonia solanacearum]
MKHQHVKLDKLEFDLENPRFEPVSNQIEALQAVVSNSPPKLVRLAEHIVEHGINPSERIILVANSGGRYAVVEGNRRLATLKLLAKPELLQTINIPSGAANTIRALARSFDRSVTDSLDAVVFDNKLEADTWIDLKHTGENGGAGTVGWDGLQTARHRKSDPAVKLLDYAQTQGLVTNSTLKERPFPITSLRRLLGDPFVRQALGLDLRKGAVSATVPPSELNKGLRKIVNDLATGAITVTDIKTKENRAQYVEGFPKGSTVQTNKKSTEPWDISKPAQAAATDRPKGKKIVVQAEKPRDHLIGTSCRMNIREERLNKIYWELRRTLRLSQCPNAIAVLFRAFLELSVDFYLEANRLPLTNPRGYDLRLEEKALATIDHLETQGRLAKKAATLARTHLNDKHSVSNAATFHAFVHNRKALPAPATLLAMWGNVEPILVAIHTP